MEVVFITTDAGVPRTLASTAFIRSIMDGFSRNNITPHVVGLTLSQQGWNDGAFEPFDTATPWLSMPAPRLGDVVAAARFGVFDTPPADWNQEYRLEKTLLSMLRDDSDPAVLVYPRSLIILSTAARICRRNGWKLLVISTEALSDVQIDPKCRDAYIRCVAREADGVWVLSEYLAEYWALKGVSADRLLLNPPAVCDSSFATDSAPGEQNAVYIGNLGHQEIEYLIDIASIVSARVPEFRLTIYGDALVERRAELSDIIRQRDLADTIALREAVPPSGVPGALSQADVLVLPRASGEFSTAGFPNKVGEYLASGRPVVVTAVGDIPKYLVHLESAYLVEPDDCARFADALVLALEDSMTSEKIGRLGQELARERLSSSAVARRLADFIAGLPQKEPTPRGRSISRLALPSFEALTMVGRPVLRTARSIAHRVRFGHSGHTRAMALKIFTVRVLRLLRLRPPAPSDQDSKSH